MALHTPDRAVLQGDHGIQDGPLTLESSTQIEHNSPYALLAVPRALLGHTPARASAAEATLLANSERLITHFDLYATLRALMGGDVVGTPPPPRWSRDLLATPIEQTRDCAAARVPAQFCPCDDAEPRHVHEPSFGICRGDQGRANRIGHAGRYCSHDMPNPMLDEPELKPTEAAARARARREPPRQESRLQLVVDMLGGGVDPAQRRLAAPAVEAAVSG